MDADQERERTLDSVQVFNALEARQRAEAERDAALAELRRYKEREEHFAGLLKVADGGQYRNDWGGAVERLVRRAEEAEARLAEAERLLRFLRPAVEAAARRECDQVEGCTYGRCGDLAAVDGFLAAAPAAPPPESRRGYSSDTLAEKTDELLRRLAAALAALRTPSIVRRKLPRWMPRTGCLRAGGPCTLPRRAPPRAGDGR